MADENNVSTDMNSSNPVDNSQSSNSLNLAEAAGLNNSDLQNNSQDVSGETNPKWMITPEMAGEGDKPDWFNDKQFKSIYDQAKSAADMRKMLGARTGAPEEYLLDLKTFGKDYEGLTLDKEDPLLQEFTKFAREQKLNQDGFNDVLKMFIDYSNLQTNHENQELEQFQKAELEALGGAKEAQTKIQEMTQWFKQNFPDYEPSDLHDMMYFAKGFEIIKALRDKIGYSHVPTGNEYTTPPIAKDELRSMLNDPRYLSDPDYQKRVDNEYARVYGNR